MYEIWQIARQTNQINDSTKIITKITKTEAYNTKSIPNSQHLFPRISKGTPLDYHFRYQDLSKKIWRHHGHNDPTKKRDTKMNQSQNQTQPLSRETGFYFWVTLSFTCGRFPCRPLLYFVKTDSLIMSLWIKSNTT
jgi:hypothetical protein